MLLTLTHTLVHILYSFDGSMCILYCVWGTSCMFAFSCVGEWKNLEYMWEKVKKKCTKEIFLPSMGEINMYKKRLRTMKYLMHLKQKCAIINYLQICCVLWEKNCTKVCDSVQKNLSASETRPKWLATASTNIGWTDGGLWMIMCQRKSCGSSCVTCMLFYLGPFEHWLCSWREHWIGIK